MAGTVVADTIKGGTTAPPVFQRSDGTAIGELCTAWVNFNGTGTVAIRDSFNVSSITDNNTGDYTVNFTTAMADANYVTTGMSKTNGGGTAWHLLRNNTTNTTGAVRVLTYTAAGAAGDVDEVNVAIFGGR